MEDVKAAVHNSLPALTEELLTRVMGLLTEAGVTSIEDLPLVVESDLAGCLTRIQIRRLLLDFNSKASNQSLAVVPLSPATPATPATPVATTASPCTPLSANDQNWVVNFQIPDDKFSAELKSHLLLDRDRLVPKLRRELVKKVADLATSLCPRPRKMHLQQIAAKVVCRYPNSLKDALDGTVVGSGHDSLTAQLVSRVENTRRSVLSSAIRRKRAPSTDEEDRHQIKKLQVIDGFGCVNFSPKLPEGETDETQLNHKVALQRMFERGQWDTEEVKRLSTLTYFLQRQNINSCMTVDSLVVEWPFLFTECEFATHVNELVGFDVNCRLVTALHEKAPRLLSYFRTVKSTELRHRLQEVDMMTDESRQRNGLKPALLLTLVAYFKEELSVLALSVEVTASKVDIEHLQLPTTPCIIYRGTSLLEAVDYALTVECKVVFDRLKFLQVFSLFFSSYFVLNIEYPFEASSTMEFIQRCFACINPDQGTKIKPRSGKQTYRIPPRVLSLINALGTFEWRSGARD